MLKQAIFSLIVFAWVFALAGTSKADEWVRGHFRSNGTYVQPYYRSTADGNFYNNWSTYPNVNPYTGRIGTRLTPPSSYHYGSSSYGSHRIPSYHYPSYGYSYGW